MCLLHREQMRCMLTSGKPFRFVEPASASRAINTPVTRSTIKRRAVDEELFSSCMVQSRSAEAAGLRTLVAEEKFDERTG